MAGLFTIESVEPHIVYAILDEIESFSDVQFHCYSRLPMRQLLRFVPSNRGPMWWITEHLHEQGVNPRPSALLNSLGDNLPADGDVVIVEALDWFVTKNEEETILQMLQECDALARNHDFSMVFPVEALAFTTRFWSRLRSIAPPLARPKQEASVEEAASEKDMASDDGHDEPVLQQLVHLVSLPKDGFNETLLAKRMLQWKRMGFDLAELEPANMTKNLDDAHAIYATVEEKIRVSVDSIRLMDSHLDKLTVTERERFRYRLMNLIEVQQTTEQIESIISTR